VECIARPLAYVMTLIMSQRILLHPRGAYPPPLSSSLFDDLMALVEAVMEGTSVIVQLPTVSPLGSEVETTYNIRSDNRVTADSRDRSYKLPREPVTDIEVCIEQSIITDAKPTNGEPSDGVTYTPPRSVWDRDVGRHV